MDSTPENSREIEQRLRHQPWEMRFDDFSNEYNQVMENVAAKEKKGHLDPLAQGYVPISEEERTLLEKDWKEFSTKRGFTEEDINEYARWLELSGQKYLDSAINDPWRRSPKEWDKLTYITLVKYALSQGISISEDVLSDYERLESEEKNIRPPARQVDIPGAIDKPEDAPDVW